MTEASFPRSGRSRLGEVALWTVAGVLTLSVHAGAAYYLMQEPPVPEADGGPPAAIMIELAALPEAVETEETVETTDLEDAQEVKSEVQEKVEEVPPEETPQPEPVVEETPPEPEPLPEPPQEVVEPLPEEVPEPIEEIDPIQEQQMAALENVEVPLPVLRPPPPPAEKKVEKKDEPEKKKVERPKQTAQPQSPSMERAKVETTQSNRTAAARTSSGFFSSSMTPAKWESRLVSHIRRKKPREIRGNDARITVAFRVSDNGSLNSIRLLRSTGDASLDQQIVAWIERASPVPAPPPEASRSVTLPIEIK
ncbi:energy transducer TonB [Rhizobium sp. Leaf311]|uniref:energy transducer TonB family protein n=1 Tax=Rhizobium sp. Leaf311 TaxID=1736332 RepID=UPI0007151662|nr:energy transducer TonB [Rhizobium sp. Leaf311]KQQ56498.1 energy transducer TonB [Rhizobium sp. Leaf311]